MNKFVAKFDRLLTLIEEYLLYILLFSMFICVLLGFVSRYVLVTPLAWADELARYLMIWGTFIGASYGVKKGAHITLDILEVTLTEKVNKIFRIISHFISILFFALLVIGGIPLVHNMMNVVVQTSPTLQIPMYLVYSAVAIGSTLMIIRYLILIYYEFTEKEADKNTSLQNQPEKNML